MSSDIITSTISKTVERELASGRFIRVFATLRIDDPRGLSDGFSVTGELYERYSNASGRKRFEMDREPDIGGCIHDEILRAIPRLKPLIDVHLADPNGVPMHAVANGWYFYSGAHIDYELRTYGQGYVDRNGTPRERAARALRVPVEDLPEGMTEAQFGEFAESLRPCWAEQARTARELLVSL